MSNYVKHDKLTPKYYQYSVLICIQKNFAKAALKKFKNAKTGQSG